MFRSKNKLVLIQKNVIFRSVLTEDDDVSPQNNRKYKPYLEDDFSFLGKPMKYFDLKYPKHTFSILTDKLTVIPQKGDQIGELGIVEKRELYFRNPKLPPLSEKIKETERIYGKLYDIKVTLKPNIWIFYGETFNDSDIEKIKEFYEDYWGMYQSGWDNFGNKGGDDKFWSDWGDDLYERGLLDH